MANWTHDNNLFYQSDVIWKNYLHLFVIECTSRAWFVRVFQFERTTFMYWPIECTLKPSCVGMFQLERITFIYRPIECTPRPWFVKMFELEGTTFIYWSIEHTLKASFVGVFQFERTTFKLNTIQKLDLLGCFNLKELPPYISSWMHSKRLICQSVLAWKNYLHLLANWKLFKSLFLRILPLENIVKEVHSSRGELNTLKGLHLSRWFNLK